MSAVSDSHGVAEADGSLMSPKALRPAPGKGISDRLGFPHIGKVLQGAPVGKDAEEAQELPGNPTRGRHDTRKKGVCGARLVDVGFAVPCHLDARRCLEELVDIGVGSCGPRP